MNRNYTKIRFAAIRELVFLRDQIRQYPHNADWLVFQSILHTLPRTYVKLYEWIREDAFREDATTNVVMRAFGWQSNMASTMLKELWEMGLLTREIGVDGYHYKAIQVRKGVNDEQ